MNTRILRVRSELIYQLGYGNGRAAFANLICVLRGEMKRFVGMHASAAEDWCRARELI